MFKQFLVLSLVCLFCLALSADEANMVLIWMTPEQEFSLETLRWTIAELDGQILTLAPEGRLLVECPMEGIDTFRHLPGVGDIELYSEPPKQPYLEGRGMGDRRPEPEDDTWIRRIFTPIERIDPNQLSRDRAALQGEKARPAVVDNSISIYFPPIGSQGAQGSCTAWAAAYYYNTYTQARDENITVSTGDYNNICSPAFAYNLANYGEDLGANTAFVVDRLNHVGTSSWNLFPYDENDYTTWPSESAWVDALKRRTDQPFSIGEWDWGCTEAQLAAIKQHLANGHIAVTCTDVYENWFYHYPDNTAGINNGVLFANSGEKAGGHAMTIVGFDDNKSYVNGGTTKYGAFLIANSWGPWWGVANTAGGFSKGFMWVAYDFFKASNSCFGVAYFNTDRPNYRPRLYAVSGLNHGQRGYVGFRGGVGNGPSPAWTSYKSIENNGGIAHAITDTKRVAVDLTDGVSSISFPNVKLHVAMNIDYSASGSGTITSAVFYYDFENSGTHKSISSSDPTVTVSRGTTGYAYVNFTYSAATPTPTPGTPTKTPTDNHLTISPTSREHPSTADTGTISVTSNVSWTAKSNASWITITSGSSGTGNGTVNYSITANGSKYFEATSSRNIHTKLQCPQTWESISVVQSPSLYSFFLAPDLGVGYEETPTPVPTKPPTSTPTRTPTPTSTPSGQTTPRSGTITINGGGITRTFTVYQAGTSSQTPTSTPSSQPTNTPTHTANPTPTPTPTPSKPCNWFGVKLELSQDNLYKAGDIFWLTCKVCADTAMYKVPTGIVLGVFGEFWFWPSWSQEFDFSVCDFENGLSSFYVFDPFVWPSVNGHVSGLEFFGAILNSEMTDIIGEFGHTTFGYTDN